MIQRMLAIWSLVPLPFLKPAWTSESSRFPYCWSLAWRILSITWLACEVSYYYLKNELEGDASYNLFHSITVLKGGNSVILEFTLVQSRSRVRLFWDPMNCSMPGLPVHHQLPKFTQTHVCRVSDAIQPSHPLSSPSAPAPNPSQHQGLFQWVNSSHEVTQVLEFQLQHQSLQWTPKTDLLQDGLVGSPCIPRDSRESSPTPQFKSINSSALGLLHSPTLTSIRHHWKNHSLD